MPLGPKIFIRMMPVANKNLFNKSEMIFKAHEPHGWFMAWISGFLKNAAIKDADTERGLAAPKKAAQFPPETHVRAFSVY